MYFLLKMVIFHCYVSLPEGEISKFFFPKLQMSHVKNPGWLDYIGYYTAQLYGALERSLLNNQYNEKLPASTNKGARSKCFSQKKTQLSHLSIVPGDIFWKGVEWTVRTPDILACLGAKGSLNIFGELQGGPLPVFSELWGPYK